MVDKQEDQAFVTVRLLAKGIVQMGRLVAEGVWPAQECTSFRNANRSKSAIR
jgi:hypothetical protein